MSKIQLKKITRHVKRQEDVIDKGEKTLDAGTKTIKCWMGSLGTRLVLTVAGPWEMLAREPGARGPPAMAMATEGLMVPPMSPSPSVSESSIEASLDR